MPKVPGNPLAAAPGEPTLDEQAATMPARQSQAWGRQAVVSLGAGQAAAVALAILKSVAHATSHLSDEDTAGVIRAMGQGREPMGDPGEPHPSGPAQADASSYDKASQGLTLLAHPEAWGAK